MMTAQTQELSEWSTILIIIVQCLFVTISVFTFWYYYAHNTADPDHRTDSQEDIELVSKIGSQDVKNSDTVVSKDSNQENDVASTKSMRSGSMLVKNSDISVLKESKQENDLTSSSINTSFVDNTTTLKELDHVRSALVLEQWKKKLQNPKLESETNCLKDPTYLDLESDPNDRKLDTVSLQEMMNPSSVLDSDDFKKSLEQQIKKPNE
jgi:Na+-transporting NADH:ubiquinone oxidoreductase subunit NqrC